MDTSSSNVTGESLDWNENTSSSSSSSSPIVLEDLLGPRRQDLVKVIPVTIIYVIIFVTGIVGNVSTCVVIVRNRYMHTATNICLFNLAVSDLLMILLGLPQETYSFWSAYPWVLGQTFCVLRTMAAETSTYASILTITAFTVERYVAICHPVKARVLSGLSRAGKIVVLIWVISATCSIPIVVQYQVVYIPDASGRPIPDSATCNIPEDRYLSHAFEASTFLFFIAPITVISVLYGLIGLAIRRSALTRTGSDVSSHSENKANVADQRINQHARARLSVIKMLVAVVVAFFLCWAPFHTQRLLTVYTDRTQTTVFNAVLFYVSGVLYYVSAVINPILYSIMSLKFRRAFKHSICASSCLRKQSTTQRRRRRAPVTGYRFHGRYLSPPPRPVIGCCPAGSAGAASDPLPSKRDSTGSGSHQPARCVVPHGSADPSEHGGSGSAGETGSGLRMGVRGRVDEPPPDVDDGVFGELNATRVVERHSGASIVIYRQGIARQRPDRTVTAWIGRQPHRGGGFGGTTGVGFSLKDRTTV